MKKKLFAACMLASLAPWARQRIQTNYGNWNHEIDVGPGGTPALPSHADKFVSVAQMGRAHTVPSLKFSASIPKA